MTVRVRILLAIALLCLATGGCDTTSSTWSEGGDRPVAPRERSDAGTPVIPGLVLRKEADGKERIAALPEARVTLPTPLACADAERIALERSPNLHAALSRIGAAEAQITMARAGYYPTLDVSASGSRIRQNFATINIPGVNLSAKYWSYEAALRANWILFDGLAREARLYGAKSGHAESLAAFEDAQRLLLRAIDSAFCNALLAGEKIRIAGADAAFNERLLDETRFKVEAGSASLSERLNFEIRLNAAKSQLLLAEGDRRVAEAVLLELMGLSGPPPEGGIVLKPLDAGEERDRVSPGIEEELRFALAHRPDLDGLRLALETSEYQVSESRGSYFPILFLQGSYGYQRIDDPWFEPDDRIVSASLNLAWNLFNGFADRARVRAAEQLTEQRRRELAARWLAVISEVRQAMARLKTARKQLALQEETLRLTRETRDLVLEEYGAGQASLVRLNEAQRDLINAEGNFALARINLRQIRDTLDAATSRNLF